jgi:hypothetical protein
MLLLIAVLAGIAAAVFLLISSNRRALGTSEHEPYRITDPQGLRPLFAPTDDELRAAEREGEEALRAERLAADEAYREEQEASLRRVLVAWRDTRSRADAAELLERAAMIGDAELFAEVAEEVLKRSGEQGASPLSRVDAAALVDSHMRLLPQEERSSGALFWLREEVTKMRKEG